MQSQEKLPMKELENGKIKKGQLNRIEGNIPPEIEIPKNADLLVIGNDQNSMTHGFHKYPAKYIPEFPRWAIRKYSNPGDVVIDPFAGSGTTNIEAMICGRKSYAVDVDPLALLLIKVKTTPISPEKLKKAHQKLLHRINSNFTPESLPEFKNRDHWFEIDVSRKLALIKECIEEEKDRDIRDFFRVSFSAIVRKVSNADPGSHKPCVRKDRDRNIPDPLETFTKRLSKNVNKMVGFSKQLDSGYFPAKIIEKDARNINLDDNSVKLAVTSPPYINALDYARTHKLEYYWLGFFEDSLVELKKKFVGTEKVYKKQYKTLRQTGIPELDEILENIFETDPKRSYIVYKYYQDMRKNLEEVYRILKPNGKYVIFIGNNSVRGITIENYKYVKNISESVGFKIKNYFKSKIINHYIPFDRVEKIDTDYVLVLEK